MSVPSVCIQKLESVAVLCIFKGLEVKVISKQYHFQLKYIPSRLVTVTTGTVADQAAFTVDVT